MAVKIIQAADGLAAVNQCAIFIDVREEYEIEEMAYDIPNQLQIPLGDIQRRAGEISKDHPIIVGCRSGARSLNACGFLDMQGYNVSNLSGGIMGWADNGYPVK